MHSLTSIAAVYSILGQDEYSVLTEVTVASSGPCGLDYYNVTPGQERQGGSGREGRREGGHMGRGVEGGISPLIESCVPPYQHAPWWTSQDE